MAMGRRAAALRNVHVNETVATVGVISREQDGIGVPDDAEVAKALVVIWVSNREVSQEYVRRNRRDGFCGDRVMVHGVDVS